MALLEKKDSVGIITLDRPNSKNLINRRLVSELEDIRREINMDDDIRVITLNGKESFSSGTDFDDGGNFENKSDTISSLSSSSIIASFDQPTIAAIDGDAFGQGLELALACDLRICTDRARFTMDQLLRGDIPWDGGTQRLSRLVGRGKAMEMILTGEIIDAREADRIGLVNRVVPAEELMRIVMDMCGEMASKGPIALKFAKEAMAKGMDMTMEQGLRLEADLYFLLHTTKDRTEGIKAFKEKRSPKFVGR
ncbi:MAG: enoyl-CoA hydratase-related protein [Desulfatiglans sp.]|nr:enoyl-CoA hydratase-related protein [Thermodesulfobacteriota bacterium]MEE4353162.1 enoyl-CoA hydratase-related protein [Desulfatiglans sp.]